MRGTLEAWKDSTNPASTTAGTAGSTAAGSTASGTGMSAGLDHSQRLNVTSVRKIADTCTPGR